MRRARRWPRVRCAAGVRHHHGRLATAAGGGWRLAAMIMLLPVVAITLLPSRAAAAPADPPTLTDWQASFHRENKQTAALAAGRARPSVLAVFSDAAVPPLLGSMGLHSLAALTGEELLAAFTRELAYAEVLHGFQASVKAISQAAAGGGGRQCDSNCGDVDLEVEGKAAATYMHNLWELPVLGERCTPDGNGKFAEPCRNFHGLA